MSSKVRNVEKRREDEAAYEAHCARREVRNAEKQREDEAAYEAHCAHRDRRQAYLEITYGHLAKRLDELGIDPVELRQYLIDLGRGTPWGV